MLILILVRFVGLSQLPGALNRDEAGIGYNAYSLLQTGKDEHGAAWPLNFASIGDYKMPGYIYATMLPVKVLGLNELAIRFWSAAAGVTAAIMLYLITKKFYVGLMMALNPWAIFYSRIGFEANLALALFLVGLYLVLRQRWWGYVFWLGSVLTYSSSLIFIPMFLFFIKPKLKPALIFITIFSIIFINLWSVSAKKSNITIFNDPATIDNYNQTRTQIFEQNPLLARTWWNKYVYFGRLVAANYLNTFSPQFLLTQGGGHPWQQIPNMGYFYWVEIFLAVSGLIYLFKSKHQWRWWLLAWLLLAPLPSAITIDAPHATRSLFLLPIIIILAGYGWPRRKIWQSLVITAYMINAGFFGYQYLINYPKKVSETLPVGLKESIEFVNRQNLSGKIYLTGIHDSSYLYPLLYTRFDPAKFQEEAVWTQPDTAGLSHAYQFGQFTIIDNLNDIVNPAAMILPYKFDSPKEPDFSSGDYKVYLY